MDGKWRTMKRTEKYINGKWELVIRREYSQWMENEKRRDELETGNSSELLSPFLAGVPSCECEC